MVTIMISRKDGESIVQADTLAKIKRITDQLMEVHGVISLRCSFTFDY